MCWGGGWDDVGSREGAGRVADKLCSGKGEGRLPGLGFEQPGADSCHLMRQGKVWFSW